MHRTICWLAAAVAGTAAVTAGQAVAAPGAPAAPGGVEAAAAVAAPRGWPHADSDIPADPALRFGALANGLRFVIRPNPEPPGRVSVRLHIHAGSLMEADDQQGLAHFLEHMVFNGTRHFTPEELVPRMQRLGIGFGAHVNAYTSFDETVYMLDLPNLEPGTLDLAFTVMRDFADGALLKAEEIDKERGVILAELTTRDSVDYRMMKRRFSELLPGSLITRRFPIGTEEVITGAPRARFIDFYTRYYTPARMTFFAVGDVDPAAMEARIGKAFGGMRNPAEPAPDPDLGPVATATGVVPAVFADPEVKSTDVALLSVRPYRPEPDTRATRAREMPLEVAHAMLGRRFARLAMQDGSPIAEGSAGRGVWFRHVEFGAVEVTAADDRWQDALPVLEQEFRRALEHGFTADEFEEARAELLNSLQQEVNRAPSRTSDRLATELVRTVNTGKVMSAPATDLEVASPILAGLDAAACHAAFRAFWQPAGLHLVLTTKEPPQGGAARLAEVHAASRAREVSPPSARTRAEFAYQSFGTPGTVAGRSEVEDLGITRLVLSNGVRVNLKRTDFEAHTVRLLARVDGGGLLTRPADKPGLERFATTLVNEGGLGRHSAEDLRSILAGRNVESSFSLGEDALEFTGRTTPEDLALQLRLTCAWLTDPGFRDEAVRQFRKEVPVLFQQLRHTPAGPQAQLEAWLHGDDPRFAPPTDPAPLLACEASDARAWLAPVLAGGPIEVSIVGDFDPAAALPMLLETFGALDRGAALEPLGDAARRVTVPAPPAQRRFEFQSKVPLAAAFTAWRTAGLRDNQRAFRRLNLLASILSDRLREEIREKLGASYSPVAGADGSEALADYGLLLAYSAGQPQDAERLATLAVDLADQLATGGATADELDRALKPALAQLEKSLRDNDYWLTTVMARCQADPQRLDLARNRAQDYASITLDEVNALARQYLTRDKALQGLIVATEGEQAHP